jgi:hypothetical protein
MTDWFSSPFVAWYTANMVNLLTARVDHYPDLGSGPAADFFSVDMIEISSGLIVDHPSYSAVAPFAVAQEEFPIRWSIAPQFGSNEFALGRYRPKTVWLPAEFYPSGGAGVAVVPGSEGVDRLKVNIEMRAEDYPDWNAWRLIYNTTAKADFDHSANLVVEYITLPRVMCDPT